MTHILLLDAVRRGMENARTGLPLVDPVARDRTARPDRTRSFLSTLAATAEDLARELAQEARR